MAFRPPEYAALINPAINAFAMRVVHSVDQQEQKLECPFCRVMKKCHCSDVGPREWSPRAGKCDCKKSGSL